MVSETDSDPIGAAFDLVNAGYAAMPDPEREEEGAAIGSDSASLRDAAEQRSNAQDEIVVRKYTGPEGKPAASNEAVTLARAARDYAHATAADRLAAEDESSEAIAAQIDALRAKASANDPQASEFYGFEPPDAEGGADEAPDAERPRGATAEKEASAELDPDLERLMRHPQVRQALEEKVGEVERARQSYVDGLGAAMQIAQASFVGQFPELAGLDEGQLPAALAQMAQQDPARFSRVQSMVASSQQLLARQQQEARRHAEVARNDFRNYAASEDARLEAMLKEEPGDVRRAVAQEITASAEASGIGADELRRLFDNEPLMRNATFQRMMYDAGKYRLMMKAKDAVASRPLPPVQRPGMAATRAERERSDLRALSTRLSTSGDLKDAVALYQARRAGR